MLDNPKVAEYMWNYVMETAPVVALYLDANGCIMQTNEQARKMLRIDAIGRPLSTQIVNFKSNFDLSSLVSQGGVHQLSISTASGMPETLYFRFYAMDTGTLAVASLDIEEQLRLRNDILNLNRELSNLTRQLHQANAELRELNELKNRFIGMAAHDLRKPISVVMTYNEILLDEAAGLLDDELLGFLRTNQAAASGMKRLIDNFLDVSIIESGHLRLDIKKVDVEQIFAGVTPLVRLIAAKKQVELDTSLSGYQGLLSVDLAKIQQVLVNLVSNAVEHSTAGQHVRMDAIEASDAVVFSVKDEGAGIAPDDQKKLFAPFGRAGTQKTAGERSVGLGLAIARQVVDAHKGRIWVESELGHGATFCVSLPLVAEH